jgi:tryptophan synthase beta chain
MEHCASLTGGRPGVLHGNRTYLLAGRGRPDPGRPFDLGGPRLSGHRARACLAEGYRAGEYVSITDDEALEAFQLCCATEGIIPALEPQPMRWPM